MQCNIKMTPVSIITTHYGPLTIRISEFVVTNYMVTQHLNLDDQTTYKCIEDKLFKNWTTSDHVKIEVNEIFNALGIDYDATETVRPHQIKFLCNNIIVAELDEEDNWLIFDASWREA